MLSLLIRSARFERYVMSVSEYEERFRTSAPSLHETFTAMQGCTRARRRRRFWAAAALASAILAAIEVAPHHLTHNGIGSASQLPRKAIPPCILFIPA